MKIKDHKDTFISFVRVSGFADAYSHTCENVLTDNVQQKIM